MAVRPALVLTGPPAVGKSTTARSLAGSLTRCAVIEVDHLRRLVEAGAAAPWEGAEGAKQRVLGVRNACALARNFHLENIDVVITDVLTPETATSYRQLLPGCLIIRLTAALGETRRRSATRPVWLTNSEFELVHNHDAARPPNADATIDVTDIGPPQLTTLVERLWSTTSSA